MSKTPVDPDYVIENLHHELQKIHRELAESYEVNRRLTTELNRYRELCLALGGEVPKKEEQT